MLHGYAGRWALRQGGMYVEAAAAPNSSKVAMRDGKCTTQCLFRGEHIKAA